MPKCIMRIEKVKSVGEFGQMMSHNYRLETVENADPQKQYMNEELIKLPEGETYYDAYVRMINASPVYRETRPRKDAVKAIDVLTAYSGGRPDEAPDLERWKAENVEWLKETFGADNVVSAVLHMDEYTPHIHAIVIPMRDGRLSCKSFLGGAKVMRELQDSYATRMASLGLERGVKGSIAKHTAIKQFYGELSEEEVKQLPPVIEGESATDYRKRAQVTYTKANLVHLRQLKEAERNALSIKGASLQDWLMLQERHGELERRAAKLAEQEKTINKAQQPLAAEQKKLARMNEMLYAIEHGLPTPEEAQNMRARMMNLAKLGREQMIKDRDELALENSNISDNSGLMG